MTNEVDSHQPLMSPYEMRQELRLKNLGEEALELARETGRSYCLNQFLIAVEGSDSKQVANNQPDSDIK